MAIFLYFTCIVYNLGITKPFRPLVCKQSQQLEDFFYQNLESFDGLLLSTIYLILWAYYLQVHGRQMVKMLVRHGANLEYVDHALRNALYWSVYNCCSEISMFLLDCGAKVIYYFAFIFIYLHFLKALYLVTLLTDL